MSGLSYFKATEIAAKSWQIEYAFTDREHVYGYLVEGEKYALVIDALLGYGNLRGFLQTLTDKPMKLVDTHFHFDHCGGNYSFDCCYIHPRDLPYLYTGRPMTAAEMLEAAQSIALPGMAEGMKEADFFPERPMRVYPIWNGDVFDLGDRRIEVLRVAGHTPGSVVLLDRASRIAYTGDACNGNTLLYFNESLSVEEYLGELIRFKRFQPDFDIMYGGHEVLKPEVIDEGIELCGRIVAGTDDREESVGLFGQPVLYGARRGPDGFRRLDGKHFNIGYLPEKVLRGPKGRQVL